MFYEYHERSAVEMSALRLLCHKVELASGKIDMPMSRAKL
jgi:hypothetical protein